MGKLFNAFAITYATSTLTFAGLCTYGSIKHPERIIIPQVVSVWGENIVGLGILYWMCNEGSKHEKKRKQEGLSGLETC